MWCGVVWGGVGRGGVSSCTRTSSSCKSARECVLLLDGWLARLVAGLVGACAKSRQHQKIVTKSGF